LAELGHSVLIYDNLSTGHAAVASILGVPLIQGDIEDTPRLTDVLRGFHADCVMHFAAHASVRDSFRNALEYYRNNTAGTVALLLAMQQAGVGKLVFSSTCAVYGAVDSLPITEDTPRRPISPYGTSKLMVETILEDFARATPDFSYATLRYFNAAGAAMDGSLGEDHAPETHLIPLVLQAAEDQGEVLVLGDDYPTPDGTAIRDYVHVDDLAAAHAAALDWLRPGQTLACNLERAAVSPFGRSSTPPKPSLGHPFVFASRREARVIRRQPTPARSAPRTCLDGSRSIPIRKRSSAARGAGAGKIRAGTAQRGQCGARRNVRDLFRMSRPLM
jgi:UDP-glucose-4-epimerase GalE